MSEQHTLSDVDTEAVFEAVAAGRTVDPELAERILACTHQLREELAEKYGVREIVVETLRESREER